MQQLFPFTTPPVKMRLERPAGRDKRENKIIIPLNMARAQAEAIPNRPAAPLRIKIAIPAAWCYTTYKGRGLAACALCRKI